MNINSLIYLFTIFSTKFRDNFEKQMIEIGLHSGQVFILNSLWEINGQSQAKLVKNLNLSAPTIYNMVTKMSDSGFIEIKKDPNDARIMRVFLTSKGRDIKPLVHQNLDSFDESTFQVLTETERMMLNILLQKLVISILPQK